MKKIIAGIIITLALILFMLFAVSKLSKADSIQGREGGITIKLNNARDSAYVFFYYPDNTLEDSVGCYPWWDSSTATTQLRAQDSPDLDSVGCYDYMVKTYTGNVWTDTLIGQWCNFGSILVEPGSGYKTYPCTLFVLQTSDSSATAGVSVTMRPLGGGIPFVVRLTDANGRLVYSSEIASISAFLYKQGESTNAEDTLVIAGSQTDSLWATAFAPEASPADMTPIQAWITTAAGDTINPSYLKYRPVKSDSTEYELDDALTYGSGSSQVIIIKRFQSAESDSALFTFNLYPNSLLSNVGLYEFIAGFEIGPRTFQAMRVITAIADQEAAVNPFQQ